VAEDRHYLVRSTPYLSKTPSSGLAKAMGLAIEWKPGGSDRITDPLTETVNCVRLAIFGVEDRGVSRGGGQHREEVGGGAGL